MTVRAHFDGRTLVPDEPLDLPPNCQVEIEIRPVAATAVVPARKPLKELAERLAELPANPDWPADGASEHDHYLYGTAKRA